MARNVRKPFSILVRIVSSATNQNQLSQACQQSFQYPRSDRLLCNRRCLINKKGKELWCGLSRVLSCPSQRVRFTSSPPFSIAKTSIFRKSLFVPKHPRFANGFNAFEYG